MSKRANPFRLTFLLAAGLANAGAADPAMPGNLENGRKVFASCAACHDPNLPSKTGPDLRGVLGRKAGTVAGFRYSRAMKNARIVWNDATLEAYLAAPQEVLPGNAMPFPGLPLPEDRRDLLAYLQKYTQ